MALQIWNTLKNMETNEVTDQRGNSSQKGNNQVSANGTPTK